MRGMRIRLVAIALVALALPLSAGAAPAFKVTLKAPTHSPKIGVRWDWQVKVTDLKGRPIPAVMSAQIIDPLGTVHAVEYGCCKKPITNVEIKGVFKDYIEFPLIAKGLDLTFRVVVKALGGTQMVTYAIHAK